MPAPLAAALTHQAATFPSRLCLILLFINVAGAEPTPWAKHSEGVSWRKGGLRVWGLGFGVWGLGFRV